MFPFDDVIMEGAKDELKMKRAEDKWAKDISLDEVGRDIILRFMNLSLKFMTQYSQAIIHTWGKFTYKRTIFVYDFTCFINMVQSTHTI